MTSVSGTRTSQAGLTGERDVELLGGLGPHPLLEHAHTLAGEERRILRRVSEIGIDV
jgi:hypothetical protein